LVVIPRIIKGKDAGRSRKVTLSARYRLSVTLREILGEEEAWSCKEKKNDAGEARTEAQ